MITLRSTKGSALTHEELDTNFSDLNSHVDATGYTWSVLTGLTANGTTASTTLRLEYGLNIIETATSSNYAAKFPLPVTGRELILVNKSTEYVNIFPSQSGGIINNLPEDYPIVIPPDGVAHHFYCIENPLPGAWTTTAPATQQIVSDIFTIHHTSGATTFSAGTANGLMTSSYGAGNSGGNITLTGDWERPAGTLVMTNLKVYSSILYADLPLSNDLFHCFVSQAYAVGLSTSYGQRATVSMSKAVFDSYTSDPSYGMFKVSASTVNSPTQIGDTNTLYGFTLTSYNTLLLANTISLNKPYIFGIEIEPDYPTGDYDFQFFIECY